MREYRLVIGDPDGLRAVAHVYASSSELARARVKQFVASLVPVATLVGPGLELALYLPAEVLDRLGTSAEVVPEVDA